MIPTLVPVRGAPWDVLPPGVHPATLAEVATTFATNAKRRLLYDGLRPAAMALRIAGCGKLYLDGSYVTAKAVPEDYDGCWDPTGMDPAKLDPVFLDFTNKRQAMKKKFGGEFFHRARRTRRHKRSSICFRSKNSPDKRKAFF
jgi:hypothetical protein